jgi:hypothetical protein
LCIGSRREWRWEENVAMLAPSAANAVVVFAPMTLVGEPAAGVAGEADLDTDSGHAAR